MAFIKLVMGFILGLTALRVLRFVVSGAMLGKNPAETLNTRQRRGNADLELVPCPRCGVFTSAPCTNPDCPPRA